MAKALGHGQGHIGLLAHEGSEHGGDEGGMQQRNIGGGHVGSLRPPVKSAQPGRQALERPATLTGVLGHLDAARQGRKLLPGSADHNHRPLHHSADQAADAVQQGGPVPLEVGFRLPHAGRSAAGQDDARGFHGRIVPICTHSPAHLERQVVATNLPGAPLGSSGKASSPLTAHSSV